MAIETFTWNGYTRESRSTISNLASGIQNYHSRSVRDGVNGGRNKKKRSPGVQFFFMIPTLVMSTRVTLPSAAPNMDLEISGVPSMTRLSRNGDVIRPAAQWRGEIILILLSKRNPKTDGKRGRVFSVGVVRVGVVISALEEWSFVPNSGSFYGIVTLIDGPSPYVTMLKTVESENR